MNTSQMNYFLCVAKHLSFTRAAEELYVSQPAVSKQVSALEHELGTELFRRDKASGLSLTPAGRAFQSLFEEFLRELEETTEKASQLHLREAGIVKMGIVEGWTLSGPVMDAFVDFTDKRPDIDIRIESHTFGVLNTLLLENTLDLILTIDFGNDLPRSPGIRQLKLVDIPRLLLYSAKHPKADKVDLKPLDFADDKLYLLRGGTSSGASPISICNALGFSPECVEMPNLDSMMLALDSGHGIAIFDEWTRCKDYANFRHIPSGTVSPVVLLSKKSNPSPAVALILRAMAERFGGVGQD